MWVAIECTNPDCRDFGRQVIHHTSFHVHTMSSFCSTCLLGRVNIRFETHSADNSSFSIVREDEEDTEVTAQFHLDQILGNRS